MRKRGRREMGGSLDTAIVDIFRREVGGLSTRRFFNRLGASQDLVLRLDIAKKLERHRGCVNTVSFSADGDYLVSGSDDRRIIIWDWQSGRSKLSFHSGHNNNIFQAKFMPFTEDRSIVTCAADGQVRHAQILECGKVETKLLGNHQSRAHKLAVEPASPHIFYSCGEDGLVQDFDLRTQAATPLFACQSLRDRGPSPFVRLNTIAIDPRSPNLFAVAGSDEYARIYDIRKYKSNGSTKFGKPIDYFCASHLIGEEIVSITGVAFSDQSELLVSYSEEFIYLFTREMGSGSDLPPASPATMSSEEEEDQHPTASSSEMSADYKDEPQVYKGHINCETVKGVNFFGPKCEYVVSGSDCGRIFIWKKTGGELIRVMEADKHVVNCIESHPHTAVLASSGIENDIKIWTPKALDRATLPTNVEKVLMPHRVRFFPYLDDVDDFEYEYDDDDDDDDNDDNDDEDQIMEGEEDSHESSCEDDDDEGDDSDDDSSDNADYDYDSCNCFDGRDYEDKNEDNDDKGFNDLDDGANAH